MIIEPGLESKVEFIIGKREQNLAHALGIVYTRLERKCVEATMPVDQRTKQPFGVLHGGASIALAESLASIGGWLNVDESQYGVVGIEINANHLRSVKSGKVLGVATPIHIGRSTQVWDVKVCNANEQIVCVSRCTLAVIQRQAL